MGGYVRLSSHPFGKHRSAQNLGERKIVNLMREMGSVATRFLANWRT